MIVGPGRPLRFLAVVLFGWMAFRSMWLLSEGGDLSDVIRQVLPIPQMAEAAAVDTPGVAARVALQQPAKSWKEYSYVASAPVSIVVGGAQMAFSTPALAQGEPAPLSGVPMPAQDAPPLARANPFASASRFSGSFWLAARDGSAGLPDAPQLGGSQVGARLRYALDPARTIAASLRVSAPLEGLGREVAVGVEWRPADAPVALLVERRFSVDGLPGGTAIMAIGGIAPTPVALGFALEGYAQAGAVVRDSTEAFADGAAKLVRPVMRLGATELALGIGAWGGAQRGVARLDVGPTATVSLPVTGQPLRLSLDWRQRVAGNARPASGPALTIGTDF